MGVIIGLSIIALWFVHLIYVLNYVVPDVSSVLFWAHLLLQTWLYTGLFITAHDAMHGTVSKQKQLNLSIGFLSTLLYAGMYYPVLYKKHQLHHKFPASASDPDYKTGKQHFAAWWFAFLKQYISLWQIIYMAIIFNILLLWFNEINLIVFWVIPSILSTFQLFYFGTYKPHKLPHTPEMSPHNSRSQAKNHLVAMLSCYFFGYHKEHHESPQTPWWKLYKLKTN